MDLKTFAQQARTRLIEGVAARLLFWGFDEKGRVVEELQPISGGFILRGDVYDGPNAYALWKALRTAVQKKGIKEVVEEAAYTWFNRIMAIKILSKNGYDDAVLDYAEGLEHTPLLLQNARRGSYAFLTTEQQKQVQELLSDYSQDQKSFSLLLTAYCQAHPTLRSIFGRQEDYTALLLPDNMLRESGFLHLLNTTDAISEASYQQVELIGWLYQFYISEKKDEVFASFKENKKAEAEDIPAATQIFTPNWIVKYMVENTAGKIWLDKNPDSALKGQMKYLVENESDGQNEAIISDVEELTLIDPACGSGHILVEGFDLLYQMYMEEYYTPEEAVASILKNNLFGLDIDVRAAQLATFAILLKAAKVYSDVWTKDWLPQLYAMPEAQNFSQQELKDFLGAEGDDYLEELDDALRLMKQAKNLGSVMKLKLSEEAQTYIAQRFEELKTASYRDFNVEAVYQSIKSYIPVLLMLTKKYSSVVANPPYMGQKNMNAALKNYVNSHYPMSKSDLFAVFMESTLAMNIRKGLMGMINQHSWMFIGSYEKLRNELICTNKLTSCLHLGSGVFGEINGEVVQSVAFVLEKTRVEYWKPTYYRLVDGNTFDKEFQFLEKTGIFKTWAINELLELPKSILAYWISDTTYNHLISNKEESAFRACTGLQTGDNKRFVRNWFEVSPEDTNKFNPTGIFKWVTLNYGGERRKWFGNFEAVINWGNDGEEIKRHKSSTIRNESYYFRNGITWTTITSKGFSARYLPENFIFDQSGDSLFTDNIEYILGVLNSKISNIFIDIIAPTLNIRAGNIKHFPIINREMDLEQVRDNINVSKADWDSRETSWDFEKSPLLGLRDQELGSSREKGFGFWDENGSPLVTYPSSLKEAYALWQEQVTKDFFQLHANEEELNRIFIDIYGLQEELTPEVLLKDITILQEELDRKELDRQEEGLREQGIGLRAKDENLPLVPTNHSLPIDRSEVMRQFVSYCVGLMMGRYRLDKPGLNIAHPNPTPAELDEYLVLRGKGLGPEQQQVLFNYIHHAHPEFSRSSGLAKGYEAGLYDLSAKPAISKGGEVRTEQSDSKSGGIRSKQYSGGPPARDQSLSSISDNSQGFISRSSDSVGNSHQSFDAEEGTGHGDISINHGNSENDEWPHEKTKSQPLNTSRLDHVWFRKQAEELIANPSLLVPYQIDDDAILPLMGTSCQFPDDVLHRFHGILDTIWGSERRTENLNFLQECMGKDLEKYLVKDFFKDHCQRYKKKPIYWLFSSKKGAFQVLVYMHRMNAFTVEKIRANYLIEHIKHLRQQISHLMTNEAALSAREARRLEQLRVDLQECLDYDLILKDVADQQIAFDLDDGVTANHQLFKGVVANIL